MVLELSILLVLVLANGLFSGAEIAVLTAAKAKVQQGVSAGSRRAQAVHDLRAQPERFLATVQIGITVIGAAAAAFGGSRIAAHLAPALTPIFGKSADELAFVAVVAGVAFLSLVLGELVPKSLALRYADGYAFAIARPLLGLSRFASPLVWFLTACSNVVLRLFGDRTSFSESRISREELAQLVTEAAATGSIDQRSSEIATRAIELTEVSIAELMVPRDAIVAIEQSAPRETIQRLLIESGHSRVPVYIDDLDQLVGYVMTRDVLALALEGRPIMLDDLVRPLTVVALTGRASGVLREMQAQRTQIAIVVDEHGGTAGLVTIENLVEELIGDILGEDALPAAGVRIDPDGSALVPAWLPTRKINRALHIELPIARGSTTLAGLCLTLALAVPSVGTTLTSPDGTLLEVVEATPRRVRMVRVRPGKHEQPSAPPPP